MFGSLTGCLPMPLAGSMDLHDDARHCDTRHHSGLRTHPPGSFDTLSLFSEIDKGIPSHETNYKGTAIAVSARKPGNGYKPSDPVSAEKLSGLQSLLMPMMTAETPAPAVGRLEVLGAYDLAVKQDNAARLIFGAKQPTNDQQSEGRIRYVAGRSVRLS
jgi:hypothetical protein